MVLRGPWLRPDDDVPRASDITLLRREAVGVWQGLALQPKGTLVSRATDGTLTYEYPNIIDGEYRAVLRHRSVRPARTSFRVAPPELATAEIRAEGATAEDLVLHLVRPPGLPTNETVSLTLVGIVDAEQQPPDVRVGRFRGGASELVLPRGAAGRYLVRLEVRRRRVGLIIDVTAGPRTPLRLAPPTEFSPPPVDAPFTRLVRLESRGREITRGELAWLPAGTSEEDAPGRWLPLQGIGQFLDPQGAPPGKHAVLLFESTSGGILGLGAPWRRIEVDVTPGTEPVVIRLD
jgi:hypothetical protein